MSSFPGQNESFPSSPAASPPSEQIDTASVDAEGLKKQIHDLLGTANQSLHPNEYVALLEDLRFRIDLELEERTLSENTRETRINQSSLLPTRSLLSSSQGRVTSEPTITPELLLSILNPFSIFLGMGDLDEEEIYVLIIRISSVTNVNLGKLAETFGDMRKEIIHRFETGSRKRFLPFVCSGCCASDAPLSWPHIGPPGMGVLDLINTISNSDGKGMHICINSYEGLTTDMRGFERLFSHWESGRIHFGLREHTVSVPIVKIVKAINSGQSDPVVAGVFEAWRYATFRRALKSAEAAGVDDRGNRGINRNSSFQKTGTSSSAVVEVDNPFRYWEEKRHAVQHLATTWDMTKSDTSKVTGKDVYGGILAIDENGIQGIASREAKRRKYNDSVFMMNNPESTLRGHSQFTRDDRVAVRTGLEEQTVQTVQKGVDRILPSATGRFVPCSWRNCMKPVCKGRRTR